MSHHLLRTALLLALAGSAHADSFTYRGQLADEGTPATGRYDLQLQLHADAAGKRPLLAPIELIDVAVKDGQFAVAVELPDLLADAAWVSVSVRPVGEFAWWPLGGREAVSLKASMCPAAWELGGNAGTVATSNFLGTTDAQAFEIRTANTRSLRIEPSGVLFNGAPVTSNVIGGSSANNVNLDVRGATISGGGVPAGNSDPQTQAAGPNRVTDHYGTVGGGEANVAGNGSGTVQDAMSATVAGGRMNTASGRASAVGGGDQNRATGSSSVIAGGLSNVAAGSSSAISGGFLNEANGPLSAIGSGIFNVTLGDKSVVPGGDNNCAGGENSFAGGSSAKVLPAFNPGGTGACSGLTGYNGVAHNGTFVWADRQSTSFQSTGPNQFLVRAQGGSGINTAPIAADVELSIAADSDGGDFANIFLRQRTNNAGILLSAGGAASTDANNAGLFIDHFNGAGLQGRRVELLGNGVTIIRSNITGANSGVTMAAGAGAWSALSDRNVKTAITAIDPAAILDGVLALPISEWSYIAQGEGIRHLGPMAQDFAAAFDLGENDTTISSIDADGVALAAIQGLNSKLERENAALRARLDALEGLVARLEALEQNRPVAQTAVAATAIAEAH